ncbi:unnamed protein product [Brachionus calyciflorus]|uniref:Autocrine proliferation repressor A-like n=1 Tax=Brachionus calyciflorus TaxID=104777 RepID=A0A813RGZ8_9BILA|nr:unnamed protein product [Brachionus calyciflorus]
MKYLIILSLIIGLSCSERTLLEDYVFDDNDISVVKHEILSSTVNQGYTLHKLNLTSLKWFNELLTNRPIWWHHVYVSVPDNLDSTRPIFYYIDDGRNNETESPSETAKLLSEFSTKCKCITVIQRQIPNQPIIFTADPKSKLRIEDDIIASTFGLFFFNRTLFPNNTYNNVPLLFPMTKAVKRGFDETVKFLKSKNVNFTEKFVVSGASKRGWTSWLITAVDQRVIATMPIVFDLLNWQKNLHIQFKSLGGGYTYATYDYFLVGLTAKLDTKEIREILKLVDPLFYLEKYSGRKFLLFSATEDQFFLPENTKAWWQDLSIQTNNQIYIKRLANVDHYLNQQSKLQIVSDIKVFMDLMHKETSSTRTLPILKWYFENNILFGATRIKLSNLGEFDSYTVTSYSAKTKDKTKIDFRVNYLLDKSFVDSNISWIEAPLIQSKKSDLAAVNEHVYRKLRILSIFNYVGFYLDVNLKLKDSNETLSISTDLNIIPEYYPIGDCYNEECLGKLV